MKILKTLILASLLLFVFTGISAAENSNSSCQVVYGGGQACPTSDPIGVSKMVQKPEATDFVENLSINDPKFSPSKNVTFKINVTNNTAKDITNIEVNDIFPQFLNFVSGPDNSVFDSNKKTLTFKIDKLPAGKNQAFTVVGKISDDSAFPADKSIICITNQAQTKTTDDATAQDSSQFCIQRNVPGGSTQVFPPSTAQITPSTGPEMLALFALIPSGISGLLLRKKSNKLILNSKGVKKYGSK